MSLSRPACPLASIAKLASKHTRALCDSCILRPCRCLKRANTSFQTPLQSVVWIGGLVVQRNGPVQTPVPPIQTTNLAGYLIISKEHLLNAGPQTNRTVAFTQGVMLPFCCWVGCWGKPFAQNIYRSKLKSTSCTCSSCRTGEHVAPTMPMRVRAESRTTSREHLSGVGNAESRTPRDISWFLKTWFLKRTVSHRIPEHAESCNLVPDKGNPLSGS